VALFKLIKYFESSLVKLEQERSNCFIIRQLDDFRIKTIKARIKELRDEVDFRKKHRPKNNEHK
jgi:hypothetical protein